MAQLAWDLGSHESRSKLELATSCSRREALHLLGFAFMSGAIFGCRKGDESSRITRTDSKKPIRIVATCGMVTDIVKAVVGKQADVIGLLGEGVDPHLYQPGRNDIHELHSADIVFYSGLMLEGGMERVLKQASETRPVFAVTDVIDREYLRHAAEFEGHPDPHVWMDVSAWSRCVGAISKAMSEFDTGLETEYQKNASEYQKRLAELDQYARETLGTIPEGQRYLVTAHDAFGYFARAYGLKVRSVQGISTQSEAAVADVNELVKFVAAQKLPAIFVESSVPEKNIQAVVEGCASRGWTVQLGGTLYSDSMGAPGTYEGTYIGMIDHNVTTIARALGGKAPAAGWQGKLNPTN